MTNSNCKLFLGLELTSYIQATDDSKRSDSPVEHSALSEIVSLVLLGANCCTNCYYDFNPCDIFENMTSINTIPVEQFEQRKLMAALNFRK